VAKANIVDDSEEEEYGDEYGGEEYGQEYDDESGDVHDYFSMQPYEVYDVVMQPELNELAEFLERDSVYGWKFKNPQLKHIGRSISLDLCKPFEGERALERNQSDLGRRRNSSSA
jgi:hypothetical protein